MADLPTGSTFDWASAESGSWTDAADWDPGTVPGANDSAYLGIDGSSYTVSLTTLTSVGSITIENAAAELDVEGIGTLNMANNLTSDGVIDIATSVSSSRSHVIVSGVLTNSASGVVQIGALNADSGLATLNVGSLDNSGAIRIGAETAAVEVGLIDGRATFFAPGGAVDIAGVFNNDGSLMVQGKLDVGGGLTGTGTIVVDGSVDLGGAVSSGQTISIAPTGVVGPQDVLAIDAPSAFAGTILGIAPRLIKTTATSLIFETPGGSVSDGAWHGGGYPRGGGHFGPVYSLQEVALDGSDSMTSTTFFDVTNEPYSSYEDDYVGGVFAGSKFEYATVPDGATYSSYETDYDYAGNFVGDKFFFTDVTGQSFKGEEEDFDAGGKLSRVLLANVAGQAYTSLEEDYNAGTYAGYKATYTEISGQYYTTEEVDVSAANTIDAVVYSGMVATPYSSVEQDYSGGAVADTIYSFTDVTGANYSAYQVEENAQDTLMQTTYDLNSGGHAIVGAQNSLTITSLGDDVMTGGGSRETFVFNPVFGADEITDFAAHESGSGHDTISLSMAEFANFAAVTAAATDVGGNVVIKATDGDALTLVSLDKTTLAGLTQDFTFHS